MLAKNTYTANLQRKMVCQAKEKCCCDLISHMLIPPVLIPPCSIKGQMWRSCIDSLQRLLCYTYQSQQRLDGGRLRTNGTGPPLI